MARRTSYPELASMCMPLEEKNLRMLELGHAFMAYRTVRPYALGKAKQASADRSSCSRLYAYSGVPPAASMHDLAVSGVRNTEDAGLVAERTVVVVLGELLMLPPPLRRGSGDVVVVAGRNADDDAMTEAVSKAQQEIFMLALRNQQRRVRCRGSRLVRSR
jgi:hypothetical protein